MKHIIILGDGMADEPCAALNGQTPLEAADTPALDELARRGRCGLLATVPPGFQPGSEIAHLSLLGYNLPEVFEGRGTLEAASMGVEIAPGEMAMRCNFICIAPDGTIKNHSAGHISTAESEELIKYLNEHLSDGRSSFFTGVSYRHLLKVRNADKRIDCTPPHDVPGTLAEDVMPRPLLPAAGETATYISRLIRESQRLLADHPVNQKRIKEGKDPANSIWPWSPGYKPAMRTMQELYGIGKGYVISAVDLIRGLGVYAGLEPIIVEGATGLYDTDYEAKLKAALDALKGDADFVFLHIEASDEAGHEDDALLKKRTVEYLDHRVVGPLLKALEDFDEDVAVALLPDHPTPCHIRTHTATPV
ncbi:MAG: cofactor-independent phosphoglycerate mutase, partial [Muribaculaceae bacterium]|nr:cofactor-independent phosphoglycerate mutase [Muribaculaceae bacterium]